MLGDPPTGSSQNPIGPGLVEDESELVTELEFDLFLVMSFRKAVVR